MVFLYFETFYYFDHRVLPGSGTAGIDFLSALVEGEGEEEGWSFPTSRSHFVGASSHLVAFFLNSSAVESGPEFSSLFSGLALSGLPGSSFGHLRSTLITDEH